jgi:hypothetical protein
VQCRSGPQGSPQPEKGQDGKHDNNEPDDVDDVVHGMSLRLVQPSMKAKSRQAGCSAACDFGKSILELYGSGHNRVRLDHLARSPAKKEAPRRALVVKQVAGQVWGSEGDRQSVNPQAHQKFHAERFSAGTHRVIPEAIRSSSPPRPSDQRDHCRGHGPVVGITGAQRVRRSGRATPHRTATCTPDRA